MKFSIEGVSHEFDEKKMTFAEGRAIEKVTGLSFQDAAKAAGDGDLTAVQALIWIAVKRDEPTKVFMDFDDVAIGDVEFEDVPEDEAPKDDDAPSPSETSETST